MPIGGQAVCDCETSCVVCISSCSDVTVSDDDDETSRQRDIRTYDYAMPVVECGVRV